MGFDSVDQPSQSLEVKHNPKSSISFFGWRGVANGVRVHQPAWLIIRSEHNPKSSISFYWLERGGRWVLSALTSQAGHQKLNIIQKWAFHFFGRRGVAEGVQVHQLAQPGLSSEVNAIQKWAFHFFGRRGVADGVWVHCPAWLIIRSWT